MAGSDNKALFFSLFVSYRFGIILDPLDPESNKLSNIFRRKRMTDLFLPLNFQRKMLFL